MVSEALISLDEQLAILRSRTAACDVDLRCLLERVWDRGGGVFFIDYELLCSLLGLGLFEMRYFIIILRLLFKN